ncbi:MAG TPA: EAL domain-containing protein [Burkholderiales bacterium]|nr:EAL domain-containing protein [Burkholderiales bacterium]
MSNSRLLSTIASPLSQETKQAVRLRRFGMAALSYLIGAALLAGTSMLGFIDPHAALAFGAIIVVINAALYAVIRSGFNLRFAEPSLTKLQTLIAITLLMSITYYLAQGRDLALMLCFVVLIFGVFRMKTREFFTVTLYTLAAYALVINLLMWFRPQTIQDVPLEWLSWLMLATVLPLFGAIGGKLSGLRHKLRQSNRELSSALETIQQMATRDGLTGTYNRTMFMETLRHALARVARSREPVSLLYIDTDRFKIVNDTLGHAAGDRVLQEVAVRIAKCLRTSDVVARLGGDEFVVLLEDVPARDRLELVARKIVESMAQPMNVAGQELVISVSVGIATTPEDGADEHALLRNADLAMYRAKELGRNGFSFYVKQMDEPTEERLALAAELRHAVERGELRLYYQPKVSIATARVTGAEALLRWQHPRLGLLAPDRFIGIAEDTGLIVPIGRWVLHTACSQARGWSEHHGLRLQVAINLSPRQFRELSLVADLDDILRESRLPAAQLELEITESLVMQQPAQAATQMRQLRERGMRLAMDDFGTGYSSLGFLKRFPVTSVKIDRAFVRDLPRNADDIAICRAVIAMAHSLRLTVTAEGVEEAAQAEFLRAEGCEEYQGYLCSPPVPEARFLEIAHAAASLGRQRAHA